LSFVGRIGRAARAGRKQAKHDEQKKKDNSMDIRTLLGTALIRQEAVTHEEGGGGANPRRCACDKTRLYPYYNCFPSTTI